MRVAEQPESHVVFPSIDNGHQGKDYVMQRTRQDRGNDITARQPGKKNRQQRLKSEERSKSEENADANSAGYRFRGIPNREQL